MKLETSRINPVLLRATYYDGYQHDVHEMAQRVVYDYEFEYFVKSDGGILIDGAYNRFHAGDMNVRRPGQTVRGVGRYACFLICVDMTGNAQRAQEYLLGTNAEAQPVYENPVLDRLQGKIAVRARAQVEKLLTRLKLDAGLRGDLRVLDAKAALMELIRLLASEVTEIEQPHSKTISEAIEYISTRYSEPITIGALVRSSGMSRAAFFAAFKREAGVTPLQMMTDLRIEKARLFLMLSEFSVAEIGRLCGYQDNAYFTRVFSRQEGMTPSEYRRAHAKTIVQ